MLGHACTYQLPSEAALGDSCPQAFWKRGCSEGPQGTPHPSPEASPTYLCGPTEEKHRVAPRWAGAQTEVVKLGMTTLCPQAVLLPGRRQKGF